MDTEFMQFVTKNLCDKSADKRKLATKEIERHVKNLISRGNAQQIKKILETFQAEMINSSNQISKKGGLLGYAAIAIAMTNEVNVSLEILPSLIPPMLSAMKDNDSKIRFQACESLYNIAKAMREIILTYFNEIFENLTKLIADLDEDVRKTAQVLDRILKDVIMEAASTTKYFNLNKFISLLCVTIRAQNPLIRKFLISWINILQNIPNINMLNHLPSFLENLFLMLGDSQKDIKESADACLMDFLKEIKESSKNRTEEIDQQIMTILVNLCSSKISNLTKLTALCWLHDYLKVFMYEMNDMGNLKLDQNDENAETQSLNNALVAKLPDTIKTVLFCLSDDEDNIRKAAVQINKLLLQIVQKKTNANLNFEKIIFALKEMLIDNKSTTTESALVWMKHLIKMFSEAVTPFLDDLIQKVIEKLQDSEETIVQNAVDLLGTLSLFEDNFNLIIFKILNVFQNEEYILNNKSYTILKKLTSILEPQKVFTTFAEQLCNYNDYSFIGLVVQKLDTLLLTDKDLGPLRTKLIKMNSDGDTEANYKFFETLYKTWSYNPVSTILLCLLTQQYELAYNIIARFADIEIDVDSLIQVAKIVQLLESPIFVYLRLQLLECDRFPFLIKSLHGLLMLLPQGKAFNVLKQRLKFGKESSFIPEHQTKLENKSNVTINIKELLRIFDENLKKVTEQKLQKRLTKEIRTRRKSKKDNGELLMLIEKN